MLNKFSEELKNKREEVGLSIQQIANKTRIDKKFLEFMEQGNFSFLPEVYVKSFIREYAQIVGLDPEETVKKFLLAKEGKTLSSEIEAKENPEPEAPIKELPTSKSYIDDSISSQPVSQISNSNQKLIIIASTFLVVIISLAVIYFFNSKDEIIINNSPIDGSQSEEIQRFEEPTINSLYGNISTYDSLSLEIFSLDTTWVYLILDETFPYEFMLYPNKKTIVKAKSSFSGTFGNSGSVKLKLNDKDIDFIGRLKLPRHFKIDRNFNLEYLNNRPIIKEINVRQD